MKQIACDACGGLVVYDYGDKEYSLQFDSHSFTLSLKRFTPDVCLRCIWQMIGAKLPPPSPPAERTEEWPRHDFSAPDPPPLCSCPDDCAVHPDPATSPAVEHDPGCIPTARVHTKECTEEMWRDLGDVPPAPAKEGK